MVFSSGIMLPPIGANVIFCCNYFDVLLRRIARINKQFVWRVYLFIYLFIIHETDAQWAKNVNKRYKIKQYINHRFITSKES